MKETNQRRKDESGKIRVKEKKDKSSLIAKYRLTICPSGQNDNLLIYSNPQDIGFNLRNSSLSFTYRFPSILGSISISTLTLHLLSCLTVRKLFSLRPRDLPWEFQFLPPLPSLSLSLYVSNSIFYSSPVPYFLVCFHGQFPFASLIGLL